MCHTATNEKKPAGKLNLDDDKLVEGPRWDLGNAGPVPATYNTLAGNFIGVTKYVRGFQSRRSPLIWKIYGQRLDGLPKEPLKGRETEHKRILAAHEFTEGIMPPPEAVQAGKAAALSDEDKRTLVRWIDLGCPVDKAFDAKNPQDRGSGWLFDDQRPTLTVAYPGPGANADLSRILVGMHDYGTGLDAKSFTVTADFPIDGAKPGDNLASRFKAGSTGVWELALTRPLTELAQGKLTVSVRDRQGNTSRIERTFSVGGTRRR